MKPTNVGRPPPEYPSTLEEGWGEKAAAIALGLVVPVAIITAVVLAIVVP